MTDDPLTFETLADAMDELARVMPLRSVTGNRLFGSPPGSLFGIPVIKSPAMTKPETTIRALSWRERLFSWPWRPWRKTKLVTIMVPSDEILMINSDLLYGIVMHPETAVRFSKELDGVT